MVTPSAVTDHRRELAIVASAQNEASAPIDSIEAIAVVAPTAAGIVESVTIVLVLLFSVKWGPFQAP